jgi:hypothetical protein
MIRRRIGRTLGSGRADRSNVALEAAFGHHSSEELMDLRDSLAFERRSTARGWSTYSREVHFEGPP